MNMKDEVNVSQKKGKEATPKRRQVVVETDGNNIFLVKNEAIGKLELVAILQTLVDFIKANN